MKQLTVRGVDRALDESLRQEAERRGLSVNRTVLALLRESFGLAENGSPPATIHHDLDHLAGTWSEEEYDAFQGALGEQRRIDEELWQ